MACQFSPAPFQTDPMSITPERLEEFLRPYRQLWQHFAAHPYDWARECVRTRNEDAAPGQPREHIPLPELPHLRVLIWAYYAVRLLEVDKARQMMATWWLNFMHVHEAMFHESANIGYQHMTAADTSDKLEKYFLYVLKAQPTDAVLPWIEDRAHPPEEWVKVIAGEFGLSMADAETRPVRPVPLIRDDTGQAIVGFALLTEPGIEGTSSRGGLRGEVWVDSGELFSGVSHGVQVRALPDAPGLVAAELPPPPGQRRGLFRTKLSDDDGLADMAGNPRMLHEPLTGRAVQAGGPGFRYVRDGVETKKPREKTTIYRHLLDLQLVR